MTVPKPDSVPRQRRAEDGRTAQEEHRGNGGQASAINQIVLCNPFHPAGPLGAAARNSRIPDSNSIFLRMYSSVKRGLIPLT